MKKLFILGSTGSIGTSTLNVCQQHKEKFQVEALAASSNWEKLLAQAQIFQPKWIILTHPDAHQKFIRQYKGSATVLGAFDDILTLLRSEPFDLLVNAIVGAQGLLPTVEALTHQISVAIANKETLVIAGQYISELLLKNPDVKLFPIDSEHSAIWQSLQGEKSDFVNKLILTASGGPFRTYSKEQLKSVTVEEALQHPTWKMGPKITIDSATMMNKGLEIIEAYWLYHLPADKIDVVIHPESIIHSMVEFIDGSMKAQLSIPDMRIPIAYALSYPERIPLSVKALSFREIRALHFEEPDMEKFKALKLAYEALQTSPVHPAILNAANEIAVDAFLEKKIRFTDIVEIVERMLEEQSPVSHYTLEQIIEIDRLTREKAVRLIERRL
jgi:1-deoxy-D-xylulose-5-phosphate reductoisomerase